MPMQSINLLLKNHSEKLLFKCLTGVLSNMGSIWKLVFIRDWKVKILKLQSFFKKWHRESAKCFSKRHGQ